MLTFSFKTPSGPKQFLKIWSATYESTALNGSSKKYKSAFRYTDLAKLILCFWPPLKLTPWNGIRIERNSRLTTADIMKTLLYSWITFSPISVASPPGNDLKSEVNAHASTHSVYQVSSSTSSSNVMFFLTVVFSIQACCGTYAMGPYWNVKFEITKEQIFTFNCGSFSRARLPVYSRIRKFYPFPLRTLRLVNFSQRRLIRQPLPNCLCRFLHLCCAVFPGRRFPATRRCRFRWLRLLLQFEKKG